MNGQNHGHWWDAPPSPELSQALAMLLLDLFSRAPAELLAHLAHAEGPPEKVSEVRKEHNPLIGICYPPSLIQEAPYLADVPPFVFFQKWGEFTSARRREHDENEIRRSEDSHYRLPSRPFRIRYELYTEPQYAAALVNRLVYATDQETSVYFRTEELDGDVGWNWPLRIGFLPDHASGRLFEEIEAHVDEIKEWIGPLVNLVRLDSEIDSCDLLLIPTSIREACELVSNLGIRISADCVVTIGPTDYPWELPSIIKVFRDRVTTAGVGIAPVDTPVRNWFETLIRELSHNEPIDVALFYACHDSGSQPPFLAASRRLIEFSKLAESIKSIGDELLKAAPDAPAVTIQNDDANVFGIEPGDYHPTEIGAIFKSKTDEFMFDQEGKSGIRSARVTRSAKRSMRKSEKPETVEPRWIQAAIYDVSGDAPVPPENALRAGATHKAFIHIGKNKPGWIANVEEFKPEELSDKKTYTLTVIFTEPQLFEQPQVSSIKLPPTGDSTTCEFTFQVPEYDVEKIEARISIVYKNRVLQTALLKADVVADRADTGGEHKIEIIPEAVVRTDLSGLNNRRNFDGAFILNHDTSNAPGLTAIKDKYVSFASLGELDTFVRKVDEFMTKVADYPAEYAGKLDTPATVTLLCDLAKHGRILHQALAEYPRGNMLAIFSDLSQSSPKIPQRIQIISAKSDTRLPMEFLYDRKAPANGNAQLCPKAVEALKQDACFWDCPGMQDPEKHVCPMGFWGLSKIIERHTYKTPYTENAVDGSFRFQSEPVEGRNHLDIFRGVLFGASTKADKIEVRSENGGTVTVEAGGLNKVLSVLNTVTNAKYQKVTSWTDWRDKINSIPSPTTLLLLTHTEKSGSEPALEIEQGVLVEMQSIEKDYVYSRKEPYPPVVLLIGCETGAADIEFMNFVAQFRRGGAAIIVSTGAPIRGRHAVPVTLELLNQLKQCSDQPAMSFGQVMRIVKQKMVAEGFPMVLTLMTYGDADWQIGTSKPSQ